MLHAVIMAGGSGTRFWPASRMATPKQLLNLTGDRSMIQATVDRLGDLVPPERVVVVTNRRLVRPISEQLPELFPQAIVGEPCKRDTAPCVGLAAARVLQNDPDATMVVMPADHVIPTEGEFQAAIKHALALVDEEPQRLVTFGICPTYAAEAFGYIERGEPVGVELGKGAHRVVRFREKPNSDVAREYLESGNFYWNSGIFVWKAQTIMDQLATHEPEMHGYLQTIADSMGTPRFADVFVREFEKIEGKSIDYAVMERAPHVVVIEAPFEWDDVGNWQSLPRLRGSDKNGNTIVGAHLGIETEGTIVHTEGEHLVVTIGLKDCIVVHTPDATLVASRENEELIREVSKQLEMQGRHQYL